LDFLLCDIALALDLVVSLLLFHLFIPGGERLRYKSRSASPVTSSTGLLSSTASSHQSPVVSTKQPSTCNADKNGSDSHFSRRSVGLLRSRYWGADCRGASGERDLHLPYSGGSRGLGELSVKAFGLLHQGVEEKANKSVQAAKLKRSEPAEAAGLESRQIPAFGAYWADWDFQGASYYHRANIDGKGYYIGNDVSSSSSFRDCCECDCGG